MLRDNLRITVYTETIISRIIQSCMNRNIQCDAIILQTHRMGDLHRRLTVLSPQLGLFSAIAYGARKGSGKLSGMVEPFVSGHFFLYYNPVKDQYKIEDIKTEDHREFLRENLTDLYTASFFAELVIKSFGSGGDHTGAYQLLLELLDGIKNRADHSHILIQGCWRFLDLFGLRPDIEHCASCGQPFGQNVCQIHTNEHGLWCSSCLSVVTDQYAIDYVHRRYLQHTQRLPLHKSMKVSMDAAASARLKTALLHYIDAITDGRLNTMRSGLL